MAKLLLTEATIFATSVHFFAGRYFFAAGLHDRSDRRLSF